VVLHSLDMVSVPISALGARVGKLGRDGQAITDALDEWRGEALKKSASGMKRKAHGAQRPRHIPQIGEGASTAQHSDSPAQPWIQRFPQPRLGLSP
jgi:hypothetical protein